MRLLFDYIRYNRRRVILGGYGGVAPSEKKHRGPQAKRLRTATTHAQTLGCSAQGNRWETKSNSRLGGCPLPLVIRPCLPLPRARGAALLAAYNTLHLTLLTRHAYDLTLPARTARHLFAARLRLRLISLRLRLPLFLGLPSRWSTSLPSCLRTLPCFSSNRLARFLAALSARCLELYFRWYLDLGFTLAEY